MSSKHSRCSCKLSLSQASLSLTLTDTYSLEIEITRKILETGTLPRETGAGWVVPAADTFNKLGFLSPVPERKLAFFWNRPFSQKDPR